MRFEKAILVVRAWLLLAPVAVEDVPAGSMRSFAWATAFLLSV
jgi:hypothetical protein